jgi:hypothetical protein
MTQVSDGIGSTFANRHCGQVITALNSIFCIADIIDSLFCPFQIQRQQLRQDLFICHIGFPAIGGNRQIPWRNVLQKFGVENRSQLQQLLREWDFSAWQ